MTYKSRLMRSKTLSSTFTAIRGLALAAAIVLVAGPTSLAGAAGPNSRLKGSYAFYVWDQFFFETIADIGVFTADGNGNLTVNHSLQVAPCAGCYAYNVPFFADTGFYALDSDQTGEMNFGFHSLNIALDTQGQSVRMNEIFTNGHGAASRQDANLFGALRSSANRPTPITFQCTGINPQVPFDLPTLGLPVTVIGRNVNTGDSYAGSATVNFFGGNFTVPISGTNDPLNADGTLTGPNLVGAVGSAESYTMATTPDTVQICIDRLQ